jgi:RNA polymerase sigma-70 factor (ECF subfamily)
MSTVANHADWPTLQALFPKYLEGNPLATERLFKSIQKAVLGYYLARMNNKNEAEDLSQAALLKIHFARDRFDLSQSLKTWVFTIASRTLIDHWRGLAQETLHQDPSDPIESMALTEAEILSPELKTELTGDLNQALLTLKPMDRSIVYLSGV